MTAYSKVDFSRLIIFLLVQSVEWNWQYCGDASVELRRLCCCDLKWNHPSKRESGRKSTAYWSYLSRIYLVNVSTVDFITKPLIMESIVTLRSELCSCWLANEEKESRSRENCVVAALVFLCVSAFWI